MVGLEPVEEVALVAPHELRLRLEREGEEVLGMAATELVGVGCLVEPLERELADRLQHRVARLLAAEQVLVEQRAERVDFGAADGLGRLERAAAREHREAREQLLLALVEQVVAPGDRRAKGSLALGGVARTAGQQRQPLLEPFEQRRRRQHLHARRGQLDRQRQPVEPRADRRDARERSPSSSRLARSANRVTASAATSGGTEYSRSALILSGSRLVARKSTPAKLGRELRDHARHFGKQLLEVVEHEQQPPRAQVVARASRDTSCRSPRATRTSALSQPRRDPRP